MRKFLALVMTAALALSMAAPAFAEERNNTHDVKVDYSYRSETVHTFGVDISWDSMTFIYHGSGTRTWNPESLSYEYDVTGEEGWNKTEAEVRVVNSSDIAVTADVLYEGSYGSFDKTYSMLEGCSENGSSDSATFVFTLDASEDDLETIEDAYSGEIGLITVKVDSVN